MIPPYTVADTLARYLQHVASNTGHTLPSSIIQRHMGPGVVACEGVLAAITGVRTNVEPYCDPQAEYAADITIARPCAVEFSVDGQTMDPEADRIAAELSDDARLLWETFAKYEPTISWQITGGLGLTTASFGGVTPFNLPVVPEEVVVQIFASDAGVSGDNT